MGKNMEEGTEQSPTPTEVPLGDVMRTIDQRIEQAKVAARKARAEKIDSSYATIMEALARERLLDLRKGDKLKQKVFGREAHFDLEGEVVFVRYVAAGELGKRSKFDAPIDSPDIVIAAGVDKSDGELLSYYVDSAYFEKV